MVWKDKYFILILMYILPNPCDIYSTRLQHIRQTPSRTSEQFRTFTLTTSVNDNIYHHIRYSWKKTTVKIRSEQCLRRKYFQSLEVFCLWFNIFIFLSISHQFSCSYLILVSLLDHSPTVAAPINKQNWPGLECDKPFLIKRGFTYNMNCRFIETCRSNRPSLSVS